MPISTRRYPVHKPSQPAAQARLALLSDDSPVASPPPKLKLLKVLLEASADPLVLLDRDLRIVCANRAFAAICGSEVRDLIGRDPFEIITNAPRGIFESVRDTGQRFEARHWRHDLPEEPGKAHYWDWSVVPCPDEAGKTEFLLFSTHEVTDHCQDQENVILAQERLRLAMRHACLQEEHERRELADRLHEDIIQNLAYWKMQLAALNLPKDSPDEQRISSEITDGVGEVIQRLRELTHDLSPAVLYRLGLGPALQWLADRLLEQHGLRVVVEAHLERELPEELAVTLFQCIRELLAPLPKEPEGGVVRLSVHGTAHQVRVRLEDDRKRYADAEMEERLLALQACLAPVLGSLTMDAKKRITWLRLPLPPAE
jgi:PAS domain S-box-containing protein